MKKITQSTFITQMKSILVRVMAKLLTLIRDFESNVPELPLSVLIFTAPRTAPEEEYVTKKEMADTHVFATIHLMTPLVAGRCRGPSIICNILIQFDALSLA